MSLIKQGIITAKSIILGYIHVYRYKYDGDILGILYKLGYHSSSLVTERVFRSNELQRLSRKAPVSLSPALNFTKKYFLDFLGESR